MWRWLLLTCATVAQAQQLPACRGDSICLQENTTMIVAANNTGGHSYFHFVLTNYSVINFPDATRPRLKITVSPCNGSAYLYVNPLAPPDTVDWQPGVTTWPYPSSHNSVWNSSNAYAPNSLNVRLQFMQYFIAVYVPMADLDFDKNRFTFMIETSLVTTTGKAVVGIQPPMVLPSQEISPTVAEYDTLVLSSEPIAMILNFNTSFDAMAYEYRAFYVRSPLRPASALAAATKADDVPCAIRDDTVGSTGALQTGMDPVYADPGRCVFSSPCAVATNMVAGSDWFTMASGTAASIRIDGLQQNSMYTFSILVRNPNGQMSVYTANRGTPVYSKSTTLADSSTIGIVAGSAVGGFSLLIVIAFALKWHIDKRVDAGDKRYTSLATKAARRMSQMSEARRASLVGVVPEHVGSSTGVSSSIRAPGNSRHRAYAPKQIEKAGARVDEDQIKFESSSVVAPTEPVVSTSVLLQGANVFSNKQPRIAFASNDQSSSPSSPMMTRTLSRNGSFMSPSANPIAGKLSKGLPAAARGEPPNGRQASAKVNLNALRKDTRVGVARNPFSPAVSDFAALPAPTDDVDVELTS